MMATEKNPFSVLGFAPSAFQDLSDEDIRSLVKSQHRALSMIHHPDRGGNQELFKNAQEAMEKLSEEFEFDFWKSNFLKPRKDQLVEARKEKTGAEAVAKMFQRRLIDFWSAYCHGRHVFDWESSQSKLGDSVKDMGGLLGLAGFSIFDPPALSCLMLERVRSSTIRLLENQTGEFLETFPGLSGTMAKMDASYELRILPGGQLVRQNLAHVFFDAYKPWRPNVRKEWIELNTHRPAKSYYWNPEGEAVNLKGKILGSLSKEFISNTKSLPPQSAIAAIGTDVNMDEFITAEAGYGFSEFESYFRFIKPIVKSSWHMIVVEGDREENFRFKIIGYPRKIILLQE